MGRCKNCLFWDENHICNSEYLTEMGSAENDNLEDSLIYSYNEDGCFYTGKNFGCVHFKRKKSCLKKS